MKCDRNRQRKERTPEERGILSDGLNEGEVVCAPTDESFFGAAMEDKVLFGAAMEDKVLFGAGESADRSATKSRKRMRSRLHGKKSPVRSKHSRKLFSSLRSR